MLINGSNVRLVGVFRGSFNSSAIISDTRLNDLPTFASPLLDSPQQLILFAFNVDEVVVSELSPFLFEVALENVPIAFDLEFVHRAYLQLLEGRKQWGETLPIPCWRRHTRGQEPACRSGVIRRTFFCNQSFIKGVRNVQFIKTVVAGIWESILA